VIAGVSMAFVLLSQMPYLLNLWLREPHRPAQTPAAAQEYLAAREAALVRMADVLDAVNCYVPLLWLPAGAKALAEGRIWPALGGALGMLALGTWGLLRAYRGTLQFYRGGQSKKVLPAPAARTRVLAGRKLLVERTLPAIPEQAGALALATLRSMLRASEVKMAMAMNVFMFGALGASLLVRNLHTMPVQAKPFVATGAVVATMLGLVQLMFNQFGFDRHGFRALVLLPAPRHHILLGKNLALLPMAATLLLIYLGLVTAVARLGPLDVLTAILEFVAVFLATCVVGNLVSIVLPHRVAPGSLKASKPSNVTQLLLVFSHFTWMLLMTPIFLPAGLQLLGSPWHWMPMSVLATACAALMAIIAVAFYAWTLRPLGRWLQRRERAILQTVTQEVE
jgi:ABC-2 type transport system permease protein